MTKSPRVSVVIPTFQDVEHTIEAVCSVISQSFSDWEAIVIDDGSDERVQHELKKLIEMQNDKRVRLLLSKRNRGPARTRNLGLRLAEGRYVAFLDADDIWMPDKLTAQVTAMEHHGVCLSCTAYENRNMETGLRRVRVPPKNVTYARLLYRNTIGCSTVMMDRTELPRSFFPEIAMRQDFAHWLAILKEGKIALGLSACLTCRRQFAGSLSSNKIRAAQYTWRVYREFEGFGFLKSCWYFAGYSLSSVLMR